MVLARVWHYWIGVFLFLGAIPIVLAVVAGYVMRVVRPKYPRR